MFQCNDRKVDLETKIMKELQDFQLRKFDLSVYLSIHYKGTLARAEILI